MGLKDFFKRAANFDFDDDDDDFHGTVNEYPLFSASEDAAFLKRAIDAQGVDKGPILEHLVKRNNAQRQKVKEAYKKANGKSLEADLATVLKGDVETLALALLMTPAQYDAHLLKEAMKGLGTNEDVLTEVLVSRSNQEIRDIKAAYKEEYGRDLEKDIDKENRGHYQDALLNLLKANRSEETDVNKDLADSDAETLFNAGEDRAGTNDTVFVHIFTTRSNAELRKIFDRYGKHSDTPIAEVIDDEMSGDVQNCLIAIAECAVNKPLYFAQILNKALKAYRTKTKDVIRVLVSQSERELNRIEKEYKKMYETSLQQDILAESDGDLETALLALCGKDD